MTTSTQLAMCEPYEARIRELEAENAALRTATPISMEQHARAIEVMGDMQFERDRAREMLRDLWAFTGRDQRYVDHGLAQRIRGAIDEKRRCGRCFYDGTAPNTAEHAMCEAEGGHQWTADASRDSQAQTEETS